MFYLFIDEGLPRKQRKMRMEEKMETTSCGMGNAGILWTKAMCSAPWSVITSAPAECVGMLKLDTQPRSRQKRTGWRATPGPGGG